MSSNNNKRRRNQKSGRKPVSNINPDCLEKKASLKEIVPYVSQLHFSEFKFHKQLSVNIHNKGYETPTEIQEKCIEHLIAGKNLIGIAATGTGKTGAFLMPIVEQMLDDDNTDAIVVVPTRELALQVHEEFISLSKKTELSSSCFIGGTNVNRDISLAKAKKRMIIGTPGRINDLIKRNALKLHSTSILVIDEFDRMLDMGFVRDIEKIVSEMKSRKQTMLFSATVDSSQEKMIKQIVDNPVRVNVTSGLKSSDNVDQKIIRVGVNENKYDLLLKLLKGKSFEKVILFSETKHVANKLCKKLTKSGIKSDVIHGNKSQNYRTNAINMFKKGKLKVLVATDVAARGIDINGITHVINYQLPQTMDSYIHRIGRTGRAGNVGEAYTFVN
jgi:ATP-dependent RNA helicase RhlE